MVTKTDLILSILFTGFITFGMTFSCAKKQEIAELKTESSRWKEAYLTLKEETSKNNKQVKEAIQELENYYNQGYRLMKVEEKPNE